MPDLKEIMTETIKSVFLSPVALFVALLVAIVEQKWFNRQYPFLASSMVAAIIIIQYPFLWKEALMIALLCVTSGLLRHRH